MSANSAIEWTDASWNIVTGCDRVSPGCDRCYIERTPPFRIEGRRFDADGRMGIRLHRDRLDWPSKWRAPKLVFTPSLGDLFHKDVPVGFIQQVWDVMADTPRHTFQILTKRPQRMAKLVGAGADGQLWTTRGGVVLPNVWLGTSIESDAYTFRADHLRNTPAAVRWLSLEPLLGPLPSLDLTGIDWVVVGGESGPGARPMHPDWVRDIRDRCVDAGVPFFFKQWGEWAPAPWKVAREDEHLGATHAVRSDSGHLHELGHKPWSLERREPEPEPWAGLRRVGKKAAGRTLDGRTWDQYPEAVTGDG